MNVSIPDMADVSGLGVWYSLIKKGGAVKVRGNYPDGSVGVEFPAAEATGSDEELIAKAKPLIDMMIWDKLYGDLYDAQLTK